MKILSKRGEKDYYDYLQGIMGIDEKVTYDRRGSTVVNVSEYYNPEFPYEYDLYFSNKPFNCDKHKTKKSVWQSCRYQNRINRHTWSWKKKDDVYEGSIYHLYLEVGYIRFIFEVERYLDDENKIHVDVSIVDKKRLGKNDKKTKEPLYISQFYYGYSDRGINRTPIENPILKNTWIPRYIPAQDMWNMLYEYISSLNDKEFVDSRTNDQHIESAGFDRKISFRHRK
jgi:hypothetical protein